MEQTRLHSETQFPLRGRRLDPGAPGEWAALGVPLESCWQQEVDVLTGFSREVLPRSRGDRASRAAADLRSESEDSYKTSTVLVSTSTPQEAVMQSGSPVWPQHLPALLGQRTSPGGIKDGVVNIHLAAARLGLALLLETVCSWGVEMKPSFRQRQEALPPSRNSQLGS